MRYRRTEPLASFYMTFFQLASASMKRTHQRNYKDGNGVARLQLARIPGRRWASVSMDLIIDLPCTRNGGDAIWVVVDRLRMSLPDATWSPHQR